MRLFCLLSALALLLASCEKIDLDKKESQGDKTETQGNKDGMSSLPVLGVGQGTVTHPYMPEDVMKGGLPQTSAWVIGYVVGATKTSISNAEFKADATSNTSILLSSDSLCSDVDNCIPIELKKASAKSDFSLPADSRRFRHCLRIHGTIGTYMRKNGLRDVDEGHWMQDVDIPSYDNNPQEWDDTIAISL